MKLGMTLIALMGYQFTQAAQITCYDTKTKKEVIYIADDMGSITTGGASIGTTEIRFDEQPQAYSYYYGEYLFLKQTNSSEETVEIVAVKSKRNRLTGKMHYYNKAAQQTHDFVSIDCKE